MFYGWWIVSAVFVSQMMATGFYMYTFPLLVVPLETEFGASRTEVMTGMSAVGFVGIFLPVLIGPLVDKWSVRGLMIIGAAVMGAAFLLLAAAPSILVFTLVFAIAISLSNTLLGPMTGSTVVARWFTERRGFALGMAAIGTSVGGFIMPILMSEAIINFGWRDSLRMLAAFVLIIQLPFVAYFLRNHPSDRGTTADGKPVPLDSQGKPTNPAAGAVGWKAILALPSFWLLSVSLGLLFASYGATMANLNAYAIGLDIAAQPAARLISVIAVFGLIGKLIFGRLADRISLKSLLAAAMLLAAVGFGLLSTEPDYSIMVLATVFMGLSAGGMLPVWGAIVPALFGMANYGRAMGFMMPVIAGLGIPSFILIAQIYDRTGSYELGLQLFVGLLLLAIVLLSLIKFPKAEPA
ncbi:MAG: MFS transporter [Pseudomonadales bacterium]